MAFLRTRALVRAAVVASPPGGDAPSERMCREACWRWWSVVPPLHFPKVKDNNARGHAFVRPPPRTCADRHALSVANNGKMVRRSSNTMPEGVVRVQLLPSCQGQALELAPALATTQSEPACAHFCWGAGSPCRCSAREAPVARAVPHDLACCSANPVFIQCSLGGFAPFAHAFATAICTSRLCVSQHIRVCAGVLLARCASTSCWRRALTTTTPALCGRRACSRHPGLPRLSADAQFSSGALMFIVGLFIMLHAGLSATECKSEPPQYPAPAGQLATGHRPPL